VPMDRSKMEAGDPSLPGGRGERFPGDDLERTPARVADAGPRTWWPATATDPDAELTYTEAPERAGLVLVRDIPFTSVCVTTCSLLRPRPRGLPAGQAPGRPEQDRAPAGGPGRRLQIQERLTGQVLEALDRGLAAAGALVLLDAEHTCMTLRGTRKEGAAWSPSPPPACMPTPRPGARCWTCWASRAMSSSGPPSACSWLPPLLPPRSTPASRAWPAAAGQGRRVVRIGLDTGPRSP
jgi:GTP cyclohydrolase I